MRVRHFNIAGVAWSNFKPGIDTNGRTAIFNDSPSIDVVNVGAGIDKALVALQRGWGGGGGVRGEGGGRGGSGGGSGGESGARRLSAEVEAAGCWAALTTCLQGAA